ncbi:hypothetical protein H477_5668 [[Clostridium] sordellii ATCC 9714]|nr:hypothetical protein H477_5668 [[Clostridium] sordellii ATCC 9714] [Paeniclostridium sordellii ATCC 9714]
MIYKKAKSKYDEEYEDYMYNLEMKIIIMNKKKKMNCKKKY